MKHALFLVCLLVGCSGDDLGDLAVTDAGVPDHAVLPGDSDGDGLTDADELKLAKAYSPFLSASPADACGLSGLVVRVTPIDPAPLVALRWAWVFDHRCDGQSVEGDGGAFVTIIDPRVPAPGGFISLRGLSRLGGSCQRLSTCGQCSGQPTCATLAGLPAVWAGENVHQIYVNKPLSCTQVTPCASTCVDATSTAQPPIVNVGEPESPMVHDLTDEGFVRPELGWTSASLLHYAPWGGAPFGALTPLSELLAGPLSTAPACLMP